jgi:hypothetical protein
MRKLYVLLTGVCIATGIKAQTDTTKNPASDTLHVGSLIIVKKGGSDSSYNAHVDVNINLRSHKHANVKTNWGVIDLGFSNFNDKTNYAGAAAQQFAPGSNSNWFDLRNGKSVNVNIWFFMQTRNLIDHVVNLKTGLGLELNNYRFNNPVLYDKATDTWTMDVVRHYHKNKLAADYLTVPLMLNFDLTPGKSSNNSIGFSAGISAGYLYSSRQKTITNEDGKQKTHDDFNMEPFKISYVAELKLGPISLYGSLATRSMFKNGLDQTPYNFGIRLSN